MEVGKTLDSPRPVRILTVCTGNICRSPVAERLLQAGLDQVRPGAFIVRSAGTRAMVGDPIQPLSADIIRTYGGTPDSFAARQLTPKILRESDLVLAMTAKHRGDVMQMDASLLKRTFTIREFARMLEVLEQRDAPSHVVTFRPFGGNSPPGRPPCGTWRWPRTPPTTTLWTPTGASRSCTTRWRTSSPRPSSPSCGSRADRS